MANGVRRDCGYDLVRIVLMATLPLIHVVQYWGYVCDGADLMVRRDADALYPMAQFALYYTAPCFMIMMGINMLLTRHDRPRDFLRRGILLLALEFAFNVIRYLLPACIGFAMGEYKPEVMSYAVFGLFNSDILAFAGLAFIVMAALRRLNASPRQVMLQATLMWLTGIALTHFAAPWLGDHCGSQCLNILGSLLWVNADSNFPLITWMIYPAIGYLFMDCLRRAATEAKRDKIWSACGLGGLLLMLLTCAVARYRALPFYETLCVNGAHHLLTPWVVLFSTGATFFLLSVCHWLAPLLRPAPRLERTVMAMGSRLTSFYLIQWTLVGWGLFLTGGTNLWGCQRLTLLPAILAIVAITAVSLLFSLSEKRKVNSEKC